MANNSGTGSTAGIVVPLNGFSTKHRRIRKLVQTTAAGGGAVTGTLYEERYLYHRWNLLATWRAAGGGAFALHQSYTWGTDLSGDMQGAGGVGGLLTVCQYAPASNSTWHPAYDGNGDVMALIDSAGLAVANYEYDAFGQELRATGPAALANPFRFSTKYTDNETSLLYYGYRYLKPEWGRWISRDPIGERGGYNMLAFLTNQAVASTDVSGLFEFVADPNKPEKKGYVAFSDENPSSMQYVLTTRTQIVACDGKRFTTETVPITINERADSKKGGDGTHDGLWLMTDGSYRAYFNPFNANDRDGVPLSSVDMGSEGTVIIKMKYIRVQGGSKLPDGSPPGNAGVGMLPDYLERDKPSMSGDHLPRDAHPKVQTIAIKWNYCIKESYYRVTANPAMEIGPNRKGRGNG